MKPFMPEGRAQTLFATLCSIPHTSGHEQAVAAWIDETAARLGYAHEIDRRGNCLVKIPATKGCEALPPVLLQGHMDMVGTKTAESAHDFLTDPLKLYVEERDGKTLLRADGTTLGADDGVAVAYMMAIMEDNDFPHPPLECLFTVEEETGMYGALELDYSKLQARRMIGLDSAGEHHLMVGNYCSELPAFTIPMEAAENTLPAMTVQLSGLTVQSIQTAPLRPEDNAIRLLAKLLLDADLPLSLVSLQGGVAENFWPVFCNAVLCGEAAVLSAAKEKLCALAAALQPEAKLTFAETEAKRCFTPESTRNAMALLYAIPSEPMETEGEILWSSNLLGTVETVENTLVTTGSTRCRDNAHNRQVCQMLETLAQQYGAQVSFTVRYRSWEYQADSAMRALAQTLFREMRGVEIEEALCPGGLEASLFANTLPGIDILEVGPFCGDFHTPKEWMDLESFDTIYRMVREILVRLTK